MKKALYLIVIALFFSFTAFSQKLGKPTQPSVQPTAAQQKTMNEGSALHDTKKYAEAIAKYRSVLAESPDCTAAMYELALSLQEKGDKLEATETAYRGTKYIGDELPLFYAVIASNLDDFGKADEAIQIYQDGLKALEGDNRFVHSRSSLQYNLGITYARQKKSAEARQALKSAVESDFSYASPNYVLAIVFKNSKYQIPAFLAASRFVSLEFNTQRTKSSVDLIASSLEPAAKDPKTGNITINLDFSAPKDEGEFGMYEMMVPTLTTIDDKKEQNKSPNKKFIDAVGTVIALLSEDKKLSSTFVGKTYLPFMVELKKAGHLEAFGNMVLFIRNNGNAEAAKWIDSNGPKLQDFLAWAKAYKLAGK